jgi:hypothetical protein
MENIANGIKCILLIFGFTLAACTNKTDSYKIDLAGKWDFQLDSTDIGITEKWFLNRLEDEVTLPGSMLTNGKGNEVSVNTNWTGGFWNNAWFKAPEYEKYRKEGNIKVSFWLQPEKVYAGAAWYQKKINVPESWTGRKLELFLERCHWETTVWIDSTKIGMQNALGAPHIYDLSGILTPGQHLLTIRIDNRIKDIDPGKDAHSVSDNTQTNWNGIIGRMEISSRPPVFIDALQLFTDVEKNIVRVDASIVNQSGKTGDYQFSVTAAAMGNQDPGKNKEIKQNIQLNKDTTLISINLPMGENPLLWDEFHPNLYSLQAEIKGEAGVDVLASEFGMRKFSVDGRCFSVNNRPVFLRGTLECAIFPKTGFPPTGVEEWIRIFRICKSFGLNHVRFHSWCPPEAAFIAADREGIYLSVESSAWASIGDGKAIDQFVYDESRRIVAAFGNHPSFCMMAYGNEASGQNRVEFLTGFVNYWKAKDPRRLYTSASGFPTSEASDYTSSPEPRIQWWEAGLNSPINAFPPTTDFDWSKLIDKNKPTVSHEIGQWCVYPDFNEMKQYDGVLKPKNFEIFQDRLKENGLLPLADSFLMASGKLQVLCYKADIEAALRTPDFAGFQLLDLHDFPGQGTALVGVLNPFWNEKPYVTASEYRRFCNSIVPLARMKKMIFSNDEEFIFIPEVSNFSESPLTNQSVKWKLASATGDIVREGSLNNLDLPVGLTKFDSIRCSLNTRIKPEKLILSVAVDTLWNSWDIWVYPAKLQANPDFKNIRVCQLMDKATLSFLESGGNVLLTVKKGSINPSWGGKIAVGFSSIFWNTSWTNAQPPHTLGILCNPEHPAFNEFPTEYHSNWQWWDAMSHSNVIMLDSISNGMQPIVRVIDDWFTARSIGLLFECKIGKGKILISGIDLITDQEKRPEARQLLYSLKSYMASEKFNPSGSVNADKVDRMMATDKK